MLELLKEQGRRLVEEQLSHAGDKEIKLSPKIDIEEKLRNGYITAEDYEKTHPINEGKIAPQFNT